MDESEVPKSGYDWSGAGMRWMAGMLALAAYALAGYALVDLVRPDAGYFSVSFAILQPAVLCAFAAWMGDPHFRRESRYYLRVPAYLMIGMWAISIPILKEGTICVIMLSPIWLASGAAGTLLLRRMRRKLGDGAPANRMHALGIAALPLVIFPLEMALPTPEADYRVERSVIIDASPRAIWPLMRGMKRIAEDEGAFNFSQDIAGLPRPLEAELEGEGVGARREGFWEKGIRFAEVVDRWEVHREIGWVFDFGDSAGWEFTDAHLNPGSKHMQIRRGGYRLERLAGGKQRLTLHTDYTARTHLNSYAALWGELFLGDISENLLETIRQRAEAQS